MAEPSGLAATMVDAGPSVLARSAPVCASTTARPPLASGKIAVAEVRTGAAAVPA